MANRKLDEDLMLFIRSVVPSVWALEILLFMRAHSERSWTHEELARETRSHPNLAGELMEDFIRTGLLTRRDGGCVYAPASETLETLTSKLAAAYRERPVTVIHAISSSRTDNLRRFANAFRLRGDGQR